MTIKGWAVGPIELLQHGLEHLEKGTDFDRRMAMIVIDNSVEVAIKTYLGLPESARGFGLSRKQFEEAAQSFPALLRGLDEAAPRRLVGLDPADLEWYHRLRNQLYHEGNGITVDREHVEVYGEMATQLLCSLFDLDRTVFETRPSSVGEFLETWAGLERLLRKNGMRYVAATVRRGHAARELADAMVSAGVLPQSFLQEVLELSELRNQIAHGGDIPDQRELGRLVPRVKALCETVSKL
jgi:hypothetical protein